MSRPLERKASTQLLSSGNVTGMPTTAVSLENVANATHFRPDDTVGDEFIHLRSDSDSYDSVSEIEQETEDEEELNDMLQDLARIDAKKQSQHNSFLDLDIFANEGLNELDFYNKYISIDKSSLAFHDKLKHFFILSTAGKPIYSLNGNDEVIIGYMGLITTIVSSFNDDGDKLKSVRHGDAYIAIMSQDPLIFVAISKIKGDKENLFAQLSILYEYLLSILSKPAITKSFHNRMNFDLRKILTTQDFESLDQLCMSLTYGLGIKPNHVALDHFISGLLGSSLPMLYVTNTSRKQMNSILLSVRKLEHSEGDSDSLTSDLLFMFLAKPPGKLLSYTKHKNHTLSNLDISILLSIIFNLQGSKDNSMLEDLWIPVCLPQFNPNGFVYAFVKSFYVSQEPLTLILLSGSKNSFFKMQQISTHLIDKITEKTRITQRLAFELKSAEYLSIQRDISVPVVDHFIYKSKRHNQYILSWLKLQGISLPLQLAFLYSQLHHARAGDLGDHNSANFLTNKNLNRKLTYAKWRASSSYVTGLMLSDNKSEFFCLCFDYVGSKDLIKYSSSIISWCEKYHKRFFVNGNSFNT